MKKKGAFRVVFDNLLHQSLLTRIPSGRERVWDGKLGFLEMRLGFVAFGKRGGKVCTSQRAKKPRIP
jgi:hypothetical protein